MDVVMPLYEYMCERCKKEDTMFLPMSRYMDPQPCKRCDGTMGRIVSAVSLIGLTKFSFGWNYGLGFEPTSTKQIDAMCEKKNLGSLGGGEASYPKTPKKSPDKSLKKLDEVLRKVGV